MASRLNGTGALNYQGVNAPTPPNLITMDRRPTVTDGVGMALGTYWLIPQAAVGITPQKEIWILVGNRQNIFIWKHLRGSTGPIPVPFSTTTTVYDAPGSYTYTPTDGMIDVTVECVGGGGASATFKDGGGGSGRSLFGFGGGGGSYCKKTFSASEIGSSQSFVVGSGGAVGATPSTGFSTPTSGGDSSFGSFLIAGGGSYDLADSGGPDYFSPGGIASGGDINIDGGNSQFIIVINDLTGTGSSSGYSSGGNAAYGFGFGGSVTNSDSSNANPPTGYGAGGGPIIGTLNLVGTGTVCLGSAGGDGVVIITEYF